MNVRTEDVAAALRRWLVSGKCQTPAGAFSAWREQSTGHLAFEYPEINGYALTFVAALDDSRPREIAQARTAADWLVQRLRRGDYSAHAGWDGGAIYTFDLAMIATGLISFGCKFGQEYVDEGRRVVDFLAREVAAVGRLPATARGPKAAHTGWASEGRAHLLKTVQCLLLADTLAGSGEAELAQALVKEAHELQQPDGRFVTQPDEDLTMLHPHHYALEGLWIWGTARSEEWALERARVGLEWTFAQQLPSGGLPRFVRVRGGETGPEQADATAQAVRLAYVLDAELPGLQRAVERLADMTTGNREERAVLYQPSAESPHENACATLFAAQALSLAGATTRLGWTELV